MFSGLLVILIPLIVNYLVPLRQRAALRVINQLSSWVVYLIFFFMGISLALLDNPANNLLAILHYSAISITVILLYNIVALMWLKRGLPWHSHHHQEKLPSRIAMALKSLKLYDTVVVGFATGLSEPTFLQYATEANKYTLVPLLFLVGVQLRNNGMTLRQIVLNRRGMIVAVAVVASSLIGSLIDAFVLDLPISTALAVTSSFGWCSLSDILSAGSFGPVIRSTALFNDLARELIAIMLVPGLIRRGHSTVLGLCGVTSMGLTLPVLQHTGGLDMVPAAIVHGFILNLLIPILIAFSSA